MSIARDSNEEAKLKAVGGLWNLSVNDDAWLSMYGVFGGPMGAEVS